MIMMIMMMSLGSNRLNIIDGEVDVKVELRIGWKNTRVSTPLLLPLPDPTRPVRVVNRVPEKEAQGKHAPSLTPATGHLLYKHLLFSFSTDFVTVSAEERLTSKLKLHAPDPLTCTHLS